MCEDAFSLPRGTLPFMSGLTVSAAGACVRRWHYWLRVRVREWVRTYVCGNRFVSYAPAQLRVSPFRRYRLDCGFRNNYRLCFTIISGCAETSSGLLGELDKFVSFRFELYNVSERYSRCRLLRKVSILCTFLVRQLHQLHWNSLML